MFNNCQRNSVINEQLVDSVKEVVKEEIETFKKNIVGLIQSKLKIKNEGTYKTSTELHELSKSLQFKQSMSQLKSSTKKLEQNIKRIKDDLLDPDYVTSNLEN